MKKHSTGWWIGSSIAGVFVAGWVFFFANLVVSVTSCNRELNHGRQNILAADPHILLVACREMIANRENYSTNWTTTSDVAKGERALRRDMYGKEYGQDVPEIIRKMDPLYIIVSTNRVLVFVCGPPRTGFIGYVEGADELGMLNQNKDIMLTNGLWMFTH